jgi:hypothetical protein
MGRLVGVGDKEPPTLKAVLEREVNGRAMRLNASQGLIEALYAKRRMDLKQTLGESWLPSGNVQSS